MPDNSPTAKQQQEDGGCLSCIGCLGLLAFVLTAGTFWPGFLIFLAAGFLYGVKDALKNS